MDGAGFEKLGGNVRRVVGGRVVDEGVGWAGGEGFVWSREGDVVISGGIWEPLLF